MGFERPVSRRSVLSLTAAVGVGASVVGLNGLSDGGVGESPSYEVQQGLLRFPLEPVNHADENVREFYGYDEANRHSSELSRDITDRKHVSRVFMYDGPMHPSLVLLHGHPEGDWGGRAHLEFSGLDFDRGEWVVRDDPPHIDEDFRTGEQERVHWRWGENRTDGGAFWGHFEEDFEIEIVPREFSSGVRGWRALSQPGVHTDGDGDVPIRQYQLDMDKPVTIRPQRQPILDADVTVMPGESPVFDPFEEEGQVSVAVTDLEEGSPDRISEDLYFGSRDALVEGDGAQPESIDRSRNRAIAWFNVSEAGFSANHRRGFLVGKTRREERIIGSAPVRPGGFGGGDEPLRYRLSATNLRSGSTHLSFRLTPESPIEITGFSVESSGDLADLDATDSAHNFHVYGPGLTHDADEPIRLDGREYEFDRSGRVERSQVQLEAFDWQRGVELTGFATEPANADLTFVFSLADGSEGAVYVQGRMD